MESQKYHWKSSYTIVLIASNSCGSDTLVITINLLNVGIKKPLLLNSVKVFPNPATDEVYVYFGDKELNNIKFQILDIVGHEVYFAKYARLSAKHKESLDISSRLKPGTYIVRVAAQEGVSTVKLVVR